MATSGTVTYSTTGDALITSAVRLVSSSDPENTTQVTTTQLTYGRQALNMMLKSWATNGLQLWERKWGAIFPQPSQTMFVLGSPAAAGDHAALATPLGSERFVITTLAGNADAAATALTVTTEYGDATAGTTAFAMGNLYNIGIELDSGDVQWTTIAAPPGGTGAITITAGLTGAATAGNRVFCYQTKLVRPVRIIDAFIRQLSDNSDSPINIISREQYLRFGMKQVSGSPVQLYYDPQARIGYVYMYPGFDSADSVLFIEYQSPIQDITSAADDFDLPQEWEHAIKFNLALSISPEYEVSDSKFKQLQFLAGQSLMAVEGWDQETASVMLQPGE